MSNATTAGSLNPISDPNTLTGTATCLLEALSLYLSVQSYLNPKYGRELELCLKSSDEPESDNQVEALIFTAADSEKPARFEPAAVMVRPGFDYRSAPANTAMIAANRDGIQFTLFLDHVCDCVIDSFVNAESKFGILERGGQLFIGVQLGDLQSFTALTINSANVPNAFIPDSRSAIGNTITLEVVDAISGERLYARVVILPKRFTSALHRAMRRQSARSAQLPLQLTLSTHYAVVFAGNERMNDCWAAARYISAGTDCPVQSLLILANNDFEVC